MDVVYWNFAVWADHNFFTILQTTPAQIKVKYNGTTTQYGEWDALSQNMVQMYPKSARDMMSFFILPLLFPPAPSP